MAIAKRLKSGVTAQRAMPPSAFSPRTTLTPVGQGDIDYDSIFEAADVAGLQHYFVEQGNAGRSDSLAAMRASADYLKVMLLALSLLAGSCGVDLPAPGMAASQRNETAPAVVQPPSAPELDTAPPAPSRAASSLASELLGTATSAALEPWRALTDFDFAALPIRDVPPDDGNVSPIAPNDQAPIGVDAVLLKRIEATLPTWQPGHVPDAVQRVRNYLLILAVADLAQSPIERFLPAAVLAHMLNAYSGPS